MSLKKYILRLSLSKLGLLESLFVLSIFLLFFCYNAKFDSCSPYNKRQKTKENPAPSIMITQFFPFLCLTTLKSAGIGVSIKLRVKCNIIKCQLIVLLSNQIFSEFWSQNPLNGFPMSQFWLMRIASLVF